MTTRPIKDVAHLEDKDIELKVVKIDTKRNNIVVSRKAVIEENNSGDRDAMLEKISEGSVLKGIVKNITDFGAFIDLGGVDGLLHITVLSLGAESATLQMYYLSVKKSMLK